jgi:hypothetical protein
MSRTEKQLLLRLRNSIFQMLSLFDFCAPLPHVCLSTQFWRIQKDGPLIPVSVGQAFEFTIRVDFDQGPITAARIVDNLPNGLLPGTGAATWTGVNAGRNVNGGKQPGYHNAI